MKMIKTVAIAAIMLFTAQASHAYWAIGEGSFIWSSSHGGILSCTGFGDCAWISGNQITFPIGDEWYTGTIVSSAVPEPGVKEFEIEDVEEAPSE